MLRTVCVVVLVMSAPAHAVVLCAKKRADGTFNTSVKIREACKVTETLLDPASLGLQGPAGPPGPAGPAGGPGLFVRDSNGALVGVVSDVSVDAMQLSFENFL